MHHELPDQGPQGDSGPAADARLRMFHRDQDLRDLTDRHDAEQPSGSPTLLVKTITQTTYPTVAAAYYACQPQQLLGAETEGAAGVVTATTRTVLAANRGSAIPPSGTLLLITFVGHRWAFSFNG